MQHSFISGLPTSCFYMGCLLGGLTSAMLADSSLSRKNLLMFSCLVMSVAAFATTISINIWMYLPLRPVSGFGCASIETCTIVLATKMVAERARIHRDDGPFCGHARLLSLPANTYILRACFMAVPLSYDFSSRDVIPLPCSYV